MGCVRLARVQDGQSRGDRCERNVCSARGSASRTSSVSTRESATMLKATSGRVQLQAKCVGDDSCCRDVKDSVKRSERVRK